MITLSRFYYICLQNVQFCRNRFNINSRVNLFKTICRWYEPGFRPNSKTNVTSNVLGMSEKSKTLNFFYKMGQKTF